MSRRTRKTYQGMKTRFVKTPRPTRHGPITRIVGDTPLQSIADAAAETLTTLDPRMEVERASAAMQCIRHRGKVGRMTDPLKDLSEGAIADARVEIAQEYAARGVRKVTTEAEVEAIRVALAEMMSKVQTLVDFADSHGLLEDHTFTFADGDIWRSEAVPSWARELGWHAQ